MNKICQHCDKLFEKKVTTSKREWETTRFCSVKCAGLAKRGMRVSSATEFKKGHTPWHKGLKGYNAGDKNPRWKGGPILRNCLICDEEMKIWRDRLDAKTCSRKCNADYRKSKEFRLNLSQKHKERVAKGLHNSWKGGVTPIHYKIRHSIEFKLWRESIFKRDNWTCQDCGVRGGKLHPHHIKPFATHPELRFELSNGRTLCVDCHKKTDSYAIRIFRPKSLSQ